MSINSVLPSSGNRGSSSTSAARDQFEELNNWKLNSPFLYDYVACHVLEWPSLNVEILPTLPEPYHNPLQLELDSQAESLQTLLLGTHTSDGEDNAIIIMDVVVPEASTLPLEDKLYEIHEDYGGFSYGPLTPKFHIRGKIPHLIGEPNRIRAMPQTAAVLASISLGGSVTVFDARKCFMGASEADSTSSISLDAHDKEGWGLSWSPLIAGRLATGADDAKVCVWDTNMKPDGSLKSPRSKPSALSPLLVLKKHKGAVQDVVWSPSQDAILMSVGDDGKMIVWDTRKSTSADEVQCSALCINSISISPVRPTMIAVGGGDKDVVLWDYRNLKHPLYRTTPHPQTINRLEFCPSSERFLASSCASRSIIVWDLYSIGKEQTGEDQLDGPPELIFTHCGHAGSINDLSWNVNPGFEEMIASVADDNQVQLWRMTEAVYVDDDNDEDDNFEVE